MELVNRLQEIQVKLLNMYRKMMDATDHDREFLMNSFKRLRQSEETIILQLRADKGIMNLVEGDMDFYWSRFELHFPAEKKHLFWGRMYNLIVDDQFAIDVANDDGVDLVGMAAEDLNLNENAAKTIVHLSFGSRSAHFKQLLYQCVMGIKRMLANEVDPQKIEDLKCHLLMMLFLYPEFLDKELVDANFNIDNLVMEYHTIERLLIDSVDRDYDISQDDQLGTLIVTDTTYVSFEEAKKAVALDSMNALLRAADDNKGITYEVMKMQMHLVLRMLDKETYGLVLEQLDFITNPNGFKMIDEVIGEIESSQKLKWEI